MLPFRKIAYILAALVLTARSSLPTKAPEVSSQSDVSDPLESEALTLEQPSVIPGMLAASIPVAEWQGNVKGYFLVPIDPANGQALSDYEPINLGQAISHAFSPDKNMLAVIGFVSNEHPNGGSLHLIDLRTWEDQVQELQLDSYVNAMDFSPDGKLLPISYGNTESRVLIFDLSKPFIKSKSTILQSSLDFLVYTLKFNTDGSSLMVYGSRIENRYTINEMSPEPPIVSLLNRSGLSERWRTELVGVRHGVMPKGEKSEATIDLHQPGQAIYLFPGLVFAPDRDILYVVHPDEDKLTSVDFEAEKVYTAEIHPQLTWIDRLLLLTASVAHAKVAEGTSKRVVVSPNGRYLYIVGQRTDLIQDKNGEWQMTEHPLGLQIVHTDEGSRLARYDTEASELSISSDGRYLYLRGWGETQDSSWTQIFDTSTNQAIARMNGMWLVPTRHANGAPIFASSVWLNVEGEHYNAIVDSQSVLAEWASSEYLAWLITP